MCLLSNELYNLFFSRFEDVRSYSMELESVLTALLQIREVTITVKCALFRKLLLWKAWSVIIDIVCVIVLGG